MAARPFLWPILLILWSLWAPMVARGQWEDAYEPNDSLSQPAVLGWLADGVLDEPLLTLWPSGDDDYFLFGMAGRGRAGDYIEVFALVSGPLFGCGNATIALHNVNGTELVSRVTGLCGGTVRFDMAGRAPGWYYLSVRCSSLEYGTYEITSRLPREYEPDFIEGEEYLLLATHAGAGTFSGLNIHQANDEDWFTFPLHANGAPNDFVRINFSNAEGNLDLALYRLEDLLANTNSLPPPIRSSISTRDFEEIGLSDLLAGEYVLRVYGNGYTSPGYTLTVQTPGQPILVWPDGTGTFSFDTVPAATEFSTGILVGDAATFTDAAQLDAAVSGLSLTNVNQPLPISGTLPPSVFGGGFRFNTNGLFLQSRPTGNAANLLLATLRNYSGENRPDVAISYSFDVQNALPGELPGFDVYYSLTGNPGSWQRIPALSRNETPGTHTALLSLGSWPPGASLYLLWADDNANGITDPSYTIDDFAVWPPVVRPDRFEPNDWAETNDLPTILTNHPLYGLAFEPGLSLHTTNDWDWFAFETTGWGTSDHYLRANFDPAWGSVDLFLYNEAGLLAAFNDPENFLLYAVGYSFGLTNSAEIRLANLPPDVYFLLAFSADQRIQPYYQLTVFAPLRDERGDYLEPNDFFETSTNLGTISGLRAWPGLSIHSEADVDWFRFQLPATARLEDFVSIRFRHDAGDLDLALFDSRTNLVAYSDGVTDNETISLSGLAPGTYTIVVFGYDQAVNPNYTLSIHAPGINTTIPLDRYETNNSVAQVTNQPAGWPFSANLGPLSRAARIPDLTIHQAGDADWFRFELPVEGARGQFVALLHDYRLGDLDLLLCNSNGVPITGRSSAGWRAVEQVDLQGLPPGAYFVVVTGATATVTHPAYDLVFNAATSDGNDGADITSTQREVTDLGQVRGQRTFTGYGIESASDVDWFKFTLAAPGQAGHYARIVFSHAVGDLDLVLVDSDGTTVLAESSGVTDVEQVSLAGRLPGRSYFLRVFGYQGAVNPQFTLVFNAPTDSSGDRLENNNTPALATPVNRLLSFDRSQSTLTVGDAGDPLSIHATNDVDWFRFSFARAADATHFAAISFDHTQGDLDLALFATNNTVAPLREDKGVSSGHRISLQGLPPGEYLLRVTGYNGAVNPAYLLSINAPWDAVGPDVFEDNDTAGAPTLVGALPFSRGGLSIERDDPDWFQFTLATTGSRGHFVRLDFRHAQGDLDLELWDATATAVLGRSDSVTDSEEISLEGRSPGTYLVKVFGYNHAGNPDYTLTINAPADLTGDWAEKPRPGVNNNDSLANAFDLRQVRGFQTWDPLSLHTVNDQDWFRFTTLGQALRGHFVRIEFDRTLGDLDLYVYAATNTNWVASSATGDGIEQVDLSQLPGGGAAGAYLVRVVRHNNAGSSTPYRLFVNAPAADFGDWAENNNTRTNATDLHEVQGTQLWQNLSLHRSGDEDWFKFTTVGAGVEGHAVSILFDQSLGDLNLEVWTNLAGPPLLSTNVSDRETVSLAGAPRGTTNAPLYVRVFGANHATHPSYALLITAPRAPEPDWAETNNTQLAATPLREVEDAITLNNLSIHAAGDEDWFRFTLTQPPRRGQFVRIEFNHHEGNLQLVVLGPNGFARTNDTAANVEEIGLAGLSTGTYYVKVSGVAGATNPAYTLTIQATPRLQPDFAEVNDAPGSAFDLRGLEFSGRPVGRGSSVQDIVSSVQHARDLNQVGPLLNQTAAYRQPIHGDPVEVVNRFFQNGSAYIDPSLYAGQDFINYLGSDVNSIERLSVEARGLPYYGPTPNQFSPSLPSSPGYNFPPFNPMSAPFSPSFAFVPNPSFGFGLAAAGALLTSQTSSGEFSPRRFVRNFFLFKFALGASSINVQDTAILPNLSIHQPGDDDWFRLELPRTGAQGQFAGIAFEHEYGDLQLELYEWFDPTNTPANAWRNYLVTAANTSGNGEEISLAGLAAGSYFLRVSGVGTNTNPYYELVLNTTPPLRPQGDWAETNDVVAYDLRLVDRPRSWTDLSIHATNDVDWFTFTLGAPALAGHRLRIDFHHAEGDLDMFLLTPNRRSDGIEDFEEISLEGLGPGTYTVAIHGYAGATNPRYTLSIIPPEPIGPDRFEPNNSFAQPTDLDAYAGASRLTGLTIHRGDLGAPTHTATLGLTNSSAALFWLTSGQIPPHGAATFTLNGSNLTFSIQAADFHSPLTGIALHGPAQTNQTAAQLLNLASFGNLGGTNGSFSGVLSLTPQQVSYLTNGLVYVRVASQLGSVEELRGQILRAPTPPDDRDVFRFTIAPNTVAAAPHYVTIDYDRALGDLDLELWRLSGNTSNRVAFASGQNNFISLNGQSAGTYFAIVQGRQARTANRYDLHFSLPSTSPGTYGGTGTHAVGDWTIMVYMTASDLEAHAFTNINEMEWAAAYLPASVKFAVLWDQSAARATFASGNGAQAPWGGTGVALIQPDTDPDTIATTFDTARFGERDTGDPATVTAFINWAATNAPARRYALVLWDHGGGVIGGFNLDKYDFAGESVLHADELAGALAALPAAVRTNLQLIAFDACLMAMTEVAHALRDAAPVIVGSEESIATTGYDYTTAFAALAAQPDEVSAEELAAGLVTAFQAQYQGHTRAFDTQSAVRSGAVSNVLTTALLQFANASTSATSSDWAKIRDARSRATFFFGSPGYRDLGQFMETLRGSGVSAGLSNTAQGVLSALDAAVLARASDQRNTRGLSIYFPALGPLDADYAARNGAFLVRSGWSNFLSGFFARGGGSSLAPDWAEANEVAPQAFDLRAIVGTNRFTGLNLHEPGDRDWFRFTLVSNALPGNRVLASAPAATLLLELHGLTNGTRILRGAGTNSVSLAGLPAGEFLALVRGTGTGAVTNYTLTIEAPSSAASRTDWVAGNDRQDKARDLGVPYNETWFPGLALNAGQSDWFRFATPRNQLSGGGAVLVDVIGATSLRVELYDEAGRLLPAASVATGTGTLRVDYPEGPGLAYLLRVLHPGGGPAGYTIRFDPNQPPQYLIPAGSVWRYRDDGANLGTAWRAVTYTNENGWASGRARFGYGLRETTTLSPNVNPASRPITTYFRHSFTLNNPAAVTNLVLRVLRDDGAVVYLNGVEIYRGNMPAGTPSYLTPAAEIAPDGTAFYSVPVTNLALLRYGLNVIAAELHQFAPDSPTAGFDLELLANRAAPVYALVESGASWKYLDDGSDQGTAWRAPAFNDSAWSNGTARLGYGGDGEKTVIRSNRTDGTRIITTWFRRAFTVENPSAISNLVVRLLCDDGGIVYLNGTEVFRRNLPPGTVTYQTLALAAVNPGADEHTFRGTNVNPALLQAGLNVLAVEVHQSSATSSDVGFDLELVVPRPNLRPYRYPGWADSLVVTPAVSNYTWSGSVFYDDEELFAHWTFINESPDVAASGPFSLRLFTNDTLLWQWNYSLLDPITGYSVGWLPQGISLGRLAAGVHRIRMDADGFRETAESDEWDNSYERLITVVSAASVPIRLSAPARISPTSVRLRLNGPPRRAFALEATSDLGNGSWTAAGSGVFDTAGTATLTNAVSSQPQRFYRARLVP